MVDPEPRLQSVMDDFEIACVQLEAILQHIENDGPADRQLRVTMLNNMVVALTATIEETVRSIFAEYLAVLEEEIRDHRNLRKALQNANLDASVSALRKLRLDNEVERRAEIALNLERCVKGRQHYFLMREEITYNDANFRTEQVTTIAKRSGLTEILKTICDCDELEEWTGKENLDTRVTVLSGHWNEIFDERDLVVHKISSANGWGPDRIRQAMTLVRLVMGRIKVCLRDDAKTLLETEARRARV
jgi:hypothetical protein